MTSANHSDKLDDFLKSKFQSFEEAPSRENWKKIDAELNSNKKPTKAFWIEMAVLMVFIGGALYLVFNDNTVQKASTVYMDTVKKHGYKPVAKLPKQSLPDVPSGMKNKEALLKKERDEQLALSKQKRIASLLKQQPVLLDIPAMLNEKENESNAKTFIKESTDRQELKPASIPMHKVTFPNDSLNFPAHHHIPLINIPQSDAVNSQNELHFGGHYKFNSIWILNQNTYGELWGSEMDYKPEWGNAYGLLVGYDIQQHYGVQLEWNIKSIQGEKYEDVIRKKKYTRKVKLEYTSFPILFKNKRMYKAGSRFPVAVNYLIGPQFSTLQSAEISINESTKSAKDKFKANEMGLAFGVESNVYLSKHLYFTLGLRSSIGTNIDASNYNKQKNRDGLFGSYKKSHNFLIGINGSINYYIRY